MTPEEETLVKDVKEEEPEPVESQETDSNSDDLDDDFEEFKRSKSEHVPESKSVTEEVKPNPDEAPITIASLDEIEEFKLQMFLGLFFALIDGVHGFIYKFISKTEFNKEELELDELDREGLSVYFKTKRVLNLINRLPPELIGFVHMEWLYWQKFQAIKKMHEKPEREMLHEQKKPVKKAAPKKKKKKPVKKQATKKPSGE